MTVLTGIPPHQAPMTSVVGSEDSIAKAAAKAIRKAAEQAAERSGRFRAAMEEGVRVAEDLRARLVAGSRGRAADTVGRIKEVLSKLTLVAAINPKGVARIAKQLLKELAGAMDDYAKVKGGGTGAGSVPEENLAKSGETTADAAASTDKTAPTDGATVAPDSSPAGTATATATATATTEGSAASEPVAPTAGVEAKTSADPKKDPALAPARVAQAERERMRTAYQAVSAAGEKNNAEERFLADVEFVHGALNSLLRAALASIEDEQERNDIAKSAEESSSTIDKAVATIRDTMEVPRIEAPAPPPTNPVSITV